MPDYLPVQNQKTCILDARIPACPRCERSFTGLTANAKQHMIMPYTLQSEICKAASCRHHHFFLSSRGTYSMPLIPVSSTQGDKKFKWLKKIFTGFDIKTYKMNDLTHIDDKKAHF
jgi:hypothetical protein